jgi:hypothetical protein
MGTLKYGLCFSRRSGVEMTRDVALVACLPSLKTGGYRDPAAAAKVPAANEQGRQHIARRLHSIWTICEIIDEN